MRKLAFGLILGCATSLAFAANPLDSKPDLKNGQTIYKAHCSICHMSGVAGAPKAHDFEKDWMPRITAAEKIIHEKNPDLKGKELDMKVMEYFIHNVEKGLGAMPAHGMCPKCDKKDYYDAISFMQTHKK